MENHNKVQVCFFVPAENLEQRASTQLCTVSREQPGTTVVTAAEESVDGEPQEGEGEGSSAESNSLALQQFWDKVTDDIRKVTPDDFKTQVLPLARIKKIMKLDDEVKMISAEAPVLFARAAEIFIHELTLRAWFHTEDNKRRTLQRNDIAMAISKSDQFDFLIDIVPRQEVKPCPRAREEPSRCTNDQTKAATEYYLQLAQQHQAALQTPQQQQQQQQQLILQPQVHTIQTSNATANASTSGAQQVGVTQQPVHILQQLAVQPSTEIQQVPIQLTQAQLNMIRMQMQNNSGQPIIIQAQSQQGQPQIIQVQSSQPQQQPQQQQVYLTQVATSQEGE